MCFVILKQRCNMMKMEKMKNICKRLLIVFLMLPILAFFPACKKNSTSGYVDENAGKSYIVHFYTNSDESFNIPNQTINHGELVRKPEAPRKTGFAFIGWYTTSTCEETSLWTFEIDQVKSDMTLYAKWEKIIYG